jgi:HSP20 family protein
MANLKLYNPFVADPLEDVFKGFFRPMHSGFEADVPQIKVEVEEGDKSYTVQAEIPGAKKEDINVNIDGNLVSISAEIKKERDVKDNGKVVHSERFYGNATRSFTLAHEVDQSKSEAKFQDGVLKLVLPKKANGSAKRLAVN